MQANQVQKTTPETKPAVDANRPAPVAPKTSYLIRDFASL